VSHAIVHLLCHFPQRGYSLCEIRRRFWERFGFWWKHWGGSSGRRLRRGTRENRSRGENVIGRIS
jgi:hypothetical protein